jgi:signal transduction histidine kinase
MFRTHDLRVFFNSIKGKIFVLFLAAFLVACGLTALNAWTLSAVRQRLLIGERYDDLFNSILEARRYEKNLLIYGGEENLREGLFHLDHADAVVEELSGDLVRLAGTEGREAFASALSLYRRELTALGGNPEPGKSPGASVARSTGKGLVDTAGRFIEARRERIHHTIIRLSLLPFAYLGMFLLLMAVLIKIIASSLLKPLGLIGQITARVAKGDFSPVASGGGHIVEVSGLLEALNRMAVELRTHQEDLVQARKAAALGTLAAGVAHEINNPINNILLSAESLTETQGDRLDEDGREMARDIAEQAERAGEIVRNLLDFSRMEKARFSPLDPEAVVRTSVALVRNQMHVSGLTLAVQVPTGLPRVAGDLRHLQQVFMNLMINAAQATPPGGRVELAGEDAGEFVRLTVRDTGKGIDPEHLPHIFEPFFTTKAVGKGTGLGLAVSYSIVKRHGGRIEVESAPGRGTVFSVLLPKAAAEEESHA